MSEPQPVKRVLYVEGNVDGTIGGSYFSLLFLVSNLDRSRFDPVVVFAAEHSLLTRFRDNNVATMIVPPGKPARFAGPIGSLAAKAVNFFRGWVTEPLRLARLLREQRIALVHLNNSIVRNHSWMIASRIARLPCITHERGINPRFKTRDVRLASRLQAVICISSAVRDNFARLGLGSLPLVTIHNGLDPAEMRVTRNPDDIRAELQVDKQARVVGMVGNIKPWKGQEVVVRAVAALKAEFPNLVCLLIGDSSPSDQPYRNKIDTLIKELDLTRNILITGFRSDIANYVNALEIQIHASIDPEPFGRVLLEGMALGKPLVASGGGAVPEIVVDGQTGALFEPGNSQALASALKRLLIDPNLSREFGERGRERLNAQFSIRNNVEQTEQLYAKILGNRKT